MAQGTRRTRKVDLTPATPPAGPAVTAAGTPHPAAHIPGQVTVDEAPAKSVAKKATAKRAPARKAAAKKAASAPAAAVEGDLVLVSFRLSRAERKALKAAAVEADLTVQDLLRAAVRTITGQAGR